MMCVRCQLSGRCVRACVDHLCLSTDERDRCKHCSAMRWVRIALVDVRGSLSESQPCPCRRGE